MLNGLSSLMTILRSDGDDVPREVVQVSDVCALQIALILAILSFVPQRGHAKPTGALPVNDPREVFRAVGRPHPGQAGASSEISREQSVHLMSAISLSPDEVREYNTHFLGRQPQSLQLPLESPACGCGRAAVQLPNPCIGSVPFQSSARFTANRPRCDSPKKGRGRGHRDPMTLVAWRFA
jgi:hypothetical protein